VKKAITHRVLHPGARGAVYWIDAQNRVRYGHRPVVDRDARHLDKIAPAEGAGILRKVASHAAYRGKSPSDVLDAVYGITRLPPVFIRSRPSRGGRQVDYWVRRVGGGGYVMRLEHVGSRVRVVAVEARRTRPGTTRSWRPSS